ncbi:hypothetical protein CDAR_42431 [Caerostris darwini]|uniref:Uncharacterized protein n=1 Tax=Caerostris darwini TaxID=1538125 RepID=A0AAV4RJN8_9ARAC|nr:hypothetical protein CDAR_42431 [Caerostris darwini]
MNYLTGTPQLRTQRTFFFSVLGSKKAPPKTTLGPTSWANSPEARMKCLEEEERKANMAACRGQIGVPCNVWEQRKSQVLWKVAEISRLSNGFFLRLSGPIGGHSLAGTHDFSWEIACTVGAKLVSVESDLKLLCGFHSRNGIQGRNVKSAQWVIL